MKTNGEISICGKIRDKLKCKSMLLAGLPGRCLKNEVPGGYISSSLCNSPYELYIVSVRRMSMDCSHP